MYERFISSSMLTGVWLKVSWLLSMDRLELYALKNSFVHAQFIVGRGAQWSCCIWLYVSQKQRTSVILRFRMEKTLTPGTENWRPWNSVPSTPPNNVPRLEKQ